jgi:hypothetical protein
MIQPFMWWEHYQNAIFAIVAAAVGGISGPLVSEWLKRRSPAPNGPLPRSGNYLALSAFVLSIAALCFVFLFIPRFGSPQRFDADEFGKLHTAKSDGLVCAWINVVDNSDSGTGQPGNIAGLTGPSEANMPQIAVNAVTGKSQTNGQATLECSITFPVRKGDMWKVIFSGHYAGGKIIWLPL